jgi:hypothetical protein
MIAPIKAGEKPLGIGLEKALASGCCLQPRWRPGHPDYRLRC